MRRNPIAAWIAVVALLAAAPASAEISVRTTRIAPGVEAWYAPDESVPVVDVILSFEGAGAASDPAGKAGRAAFAAAMLTEGAGNYSAQSFARALDEAAITLEIRADHDRLTIHLYSLREHAVQAGKLLALALNQPTLAEPDIARVKAQSLSLLAQLSERPSYLASRLLAAHAFKGHPYAEGLYGTPESIASLGAQDVRDYLAAHIARGTLTVSAAGDIDSGLLEDMLRPTLMSLNAQPAVAAAIPKATMEGAGKTIRQTVDVPQTVVTFAAPALRRDDPRFYTAYLLNEILGGSTMTSRLGSEVRLKKGLVYGIGTSLEVRKGTSLLTGQFATRNSSAAGAVEEVKTILATMREQGVTAEECSDAKGYVIGRYPLQLDRTGNVSSMLFTMQHYHLGRNYMQEREALFGTIRCDEINAMARELLSPERFLFAVVGGAVDTPATPAAAPAGGAPDER